jgi:site-specific DNA-adenine methylase
MKNHFYISYAGNKRLEVENIYSILNFNNVTDIIEPFCGSCAMSFYISLQQPKTFRYILNDNNDYLREMFNIICDDEKLSIFETELKNTIDFIKGNKENYNQVVKKNNLMGWFISNRFYRIKPRLYPATQPNLIKFKSLREYPIYNFFKNERIIFTSDDGLNIYNKYKKNKNALILIDPPYICSDNSFYLNPVVNIYEYLHNNNIDNEESKIILVLENNWIIKMLFKKNVISEYNKIYQTNKKQTTHVVIANNKVLQV